MNQLFPDKEFIPGIEDSPRMAHSPMVFMVPMDLAEGVRRTPDFFKALETAKTHKDLDPQSLPKPINYVHK